MNAELLLREFDRLSEGPDAVSRCRKVILDLAVQGKLHGEDADEWPRLAVAEVLDSLQTGPFGSSLHQTDYESGGTPVINPASIQDGRIIPIPKMAVGPETLDRLASFKVSSGDVVMARRGEMGRCAVVTSREHGWLCGTGCLVLHPAQAIFPAYLAMFIGAPCTRQYLNRVSVGTTLQNLNQRILLNLEIVVPSFEQQRRIVSKVDELMAVCDQLEISQTERESRRDALRGASLRRLTATEVGLDGSLNDVHFFLHNSPWLITKPEHVTAIRQSIFDLALTGRLIKASNSDGDAAELITAATAARHDLDDRARKRPGRSNLAAVTGHPLPTLPGSWRWARLDEIAAIVGGITKDDKNQGLPGLTEVPYLRVANVQRGYLDLTKVTTINVRPETASYLQLVPGDILFNEGGDRDKLGRGWIWEGQIEPCIHQNHVFRARLYAPIVDPRIVSWHGNSFGQKWFMQGGKQTTNLASVSKTTLSAFPVPIPPLAQQHRIIAKVNELMAVCDELESALANAQQGRGRLWGALARRVLNDTVDGSRRSGTF